MNRKVLAAWVFVPIITGIVLLIIGSVADIYAMRIGGVVVLFGGSFLVAVIYTIITIIKVARGGKISYNGDYDEDDDDEDDDDEDDEDDTDSEEGEEQSATEKAAAALADRVNDDCNDSDDYDDEDRDSVEITRESEREAIEKINSTYHYDNQMAMAEHQLRHISAARNSGTGGKNAKLYTVLLLVVLLGSFVGIIVSAMFHAMIGVFVCIGIFAGTIITCMIVVTVRQKISMSDRYYDKSDVHKGEVLSCTISSQTSTGGKHYSRVTSVVYRIAVDVDGEQKIAYSRSVYETGEVVDVLLNRKFSSMIKIIGLSDGNCADEDDTDEPF